MTVAELKKAVEGFPDASEVLLDIPGFEEYVEFTGTDKATPGGEFLLVCEEPDWEGEEDEEEDEEE